MQMNTGMAAHVMLFTRVGEEVWLSACLDTGVEERQTMLGYHRRVVVPRDNLQLTFQILGFAYETDLGIAFGIILGGAHIALTIHHLIPLPVDDGASGHSNFKHVGVVGYQ